MLLKYASRVLFIFRPGSLIGHSWCSVWPKSVDNTLKHSFNTIGRNTTNGSRYLDSICYYNLKFFLKRWTTLYSLLKVKN